MEIFLTLQHSKNYWKHIEDRTEIAKMIEIEGVELDIIPIFSDVDNIENESFAVGIIVDIFETNKLTTLEAPDFSKYENLVEQIGIAPKHLRIPEV